MNIYGDKPLARLRIHTVPGMMIDWGVRTASSVATQHNSKIMEEEHMRATAIFTRASHFRSCIRHVSTTLHDFKHWLQFSAFWKNSSHEISLVFYLM